MDMVERVAEAIFEAWAKEEGAESTWAEVCDRATRGGYPHAKKFHAMAFAEARAALQAMKITDTVEGVPGGVAFEDAFFGGDSHVFDAMKSAWNATIDAALTPSQPNT